MPRSILFVTLFACLALAACKPQGAGPAAAPEAAPPEQAATDASVDPAQAEANDTTTSASPAAPAKAATTPQRIAYDCGGKAVEATFSGEKAIVLVDGNTYEMTTGQSASGARYVDPKGNVFWTKGMTDATWTASGQADVTCKATAGATG